MRKVGEYIISVLKDRLLLISIVLLMVKTILFLGIMNTAGASGFDLQAGIDRVDFVSVYLAFIIIVLSFGFLFGNRLRLIFIIGINVLYSIILIGDLWYYRGFGSFLSVQLLKMTANLDNMGDSIVSMSRTVDIMLLADLVPITFFCLLFRKKYKSMKRRPIGFAVICLCSILYLSYMHVKVDIKHATKTYQYLFNMRYNPDMTISNLSPLGYHYYDTYKFIVDSRQYKLSTSERSEITQWFEDKKEKLPDNSYAAMFKGKNVIALQVESLENFVIGQKVNGQEITPNLNKLLGNSFYFSNFYEQVNGGTSSDCDLMVNTCVYPVRSGSTFFRYPQDYYNSLPRLFGEQGYTSMAIHPDKGAFWNWLPALSSMGFDKCYDASKFKQDEVIGLGLSDGSYLKQVAPIITSAKEPFYTFMVTLTSHSPFDLPGKYRELKLDKYLDDSKLGGYFQSIHYTDKQIGEFLDKLKQSGVLQNTVLVLYGDHTGIHKYYQDEVEKLQPSESWWIDDEKKIPLIIYNPSLQGEEVKTKGGHIDIYPTICYLLGIDSSKYSDTAMGRNLLDTKKDFAVLSDGKFVGSAANEEEKSMDIKGLELADKIIRGNYFKK